MPSTDSTKVSPAFNFEDHDLVIQSRDQVRFKVHKVILRHASEVWSTMLSLPGENSKEPSANAVQVMELAENADRIHTLLCFIYPVAKPATDTFATCIPALVIAAKYEVPVAIQLLSQAVIAHGIIDKDPLRVFAVAARCGLDAQKKLAYHRLLSFNFAIDMTHVPELATMTALDYCNLCHKKLERSKRAIGIIDAAFTQKPLGVYGRSHCGGACWFRKYRQLVVGRLVDNATSSALLFHEEALTEMMSGICTTCGPVVFIEDFYQMQSSEGFKEVVQQIDNLP